MSSQECKKEIDTLKGEVAQSKKNYDAVKARNNTLSSEMRTLRVQIAALVEKGRNDDSLISQLLEEKVTHSAYMSLFLFSRLSRDWPLSEDDVRAFLDVFKESCYI